MTSTHDAHSSDATVVSPGTGDHAIDQATGHATGHDGHAGSDGEVLGQVNVAAWLAGAVGIIGGLIVVFVLAVAAGWLG